MKFVDKNLAIKLKEKGFNRPCFGYYHKVQDKKLKPHLNYTNGGTILNLYNKHIDSTYVVDAPTIDQVLEWLREEKNIHIGIMPYFTMSTKNNIMWLWEILLVGKIIECENTLYADEDYNYTKLASADSYANYEDACIASINLVVEYLI